MRYKALLMDFDGTLVDETFIIRPAVEHALRAVQPAVRVGMVTGRIYRGFVEQASRTVNMSGPHVVHGGSLIYDPLEERELWGLPLEPAIVAGVIDLIAEASDEYFVEEGDSIYTPMTNPEKLAELSVPALPLRSLPNQRVMKLSVRTGEDLASAQALRDRIKARYPSLQAIEWYHAHLGRGGIDVSVATKFEGVGEWLLHTDIDRKELVVVGDGHNDFPLLMAGGLKVAMGNAPDELRAIADYVAPTVHDDGIAHVVEKFLLN